MTFVSQTKQQVVFATLRNIVFAKNKSETDSERDNESETDNKRDGVV